MKAIEIKGKVNTALCYAKVVEEEAIGQIRRMCDYAVTENSQMPGICQKKQRENSRDYSEENRNERM